MLSFPFFVWIKALNYGCGLHFVYRHCGQLWGNVAIIAAAMQLQRLPKSQP